MGAVVEIWFESLIPFLLKDSHIVQWFTSRYPYERVLFLAFNDDMFHSLLPLLLPSFIALCGYPLVKMELEIQTRFLPRLRFFQDTIISDNIFGLNIWFSLTFNIFSGGQDDYNTSTIQIPDSDSDS